MNAPVPDPKTVCAENSEIYQTEQMGRPGVAARVLLEVFALCECGLMLGLKLSLDQQAFFMTIRYSNRKTQRFYFIRDDGTEASFVLIYGDEITPLSGASPKGNKFVRANYRGRDGSVKKYRIDGEHRADLTDQRPLQSYFLDVGQGDAAFLVTPNGSKILIDGGVNENTAEFLIWKYRLDVGTNRLTIDHLFLSHADQDHVKGLIPILLHPRITVKNIWHNGIGLYNSGHNTPLGTRNGEHLETEHDTVSDLDGADLTSIFGKWIDAVKGQNAGYRALDQSMGMIDVGDPALQIEIVGPVKAPGGGYEWLGDKSHTINGHSLMLRIIHNHVRFFFSGDANIEGSEHLLSHPGSAMRLDAHVFKSPHHGSHEFHLPFLHAVRPLISVISSGDSPDHGHPRAGFLGAVGAAGRADQHLVFSTEIAATFTDADDDDAFVPPHDPTVEAELQYSTTQLNSEARKRYKKKLSGIINVRSDGRHLYAARRVMASYDWESYAAIDVTDHL